MRPGNLSRLDETLARAWEGLRPLPDGWSLGGGTAVALYLGHRVSTDLDWIAPEGAINPGAVAALEGFLECGRLERIHGGEGMVDCMLRPHSAGRSIRMTFMEPHKGFLPKPAFPAVPASNPASTPVLHPIDLAACKMLALQNRRAARDYADLEALCAANPEYLLAALRLVVERENVARHWMLGLLADAPDSAPVQRLSAFARDCMAGLLISNGQDPADEAGPG